MPVKARTHIFDNREELFRYFRSMIIAYNGAIVEDTAEALKLNKDQIMAMHNVIDDNFVTLADNIKCFAGEYEQLVEDGVITDEQKYRARSDVEGQSMEELRTSVFENIESVEEMYGLNDEEGVGDENSDAE